jgi:DUF1680 family protein
MIRRSQISRRELKSTSDHKPYYSYSPKPIEARQVELRFIPYYAWANRGPTPMRVWTPVFRA